MTAKKIEGVVILWVYMKSGNVLKLPVSDWEITRDGMAIQDIKWTMSTDEEQNPVRARLPFISLPEIEAVVVTDA